MGTKRSGTTVVRSIAATFLASATTAGLSQYNAVILDAGGFQHAEGYGISQGLAVGRVSTNGFVVSHAAMWSSLGFSDLNPGGDYSASYLLGAASGVQVGRASGVTAPNGHAGLWRGAAASFVDLHPVTDISGSAAYATNGRQQVGELVDFNHTRAALWTGTADSFVDLTPSGFNFASALTISGDGTVGGSGSGQATGGNGHALLWFGSPSNYLDIHPIGFASSQVHGIFGSEQVGSGAVPSGRNHAIRWLGTVASAVDMQPAGFTSSYAYGTNGNLQVGEVRSAGVQHACLWSGSTQTFIDLNPLLPQGLTQSVAQAIDESGVIVGSASDANRAYAVKWVPVPEPNSLVSVVLFLMVLTKRRRRTRSYLQFGTSGRTTVYFKRFGL